MDKKIDRKNNFSAVSIDRITAERFRAFSKDFSRSHSETIENMMDFFERTKINPKSEVMISYIRFQNYMVGRFDYIIELIREQEQKYHKPTHDMLKSLFDRTALKKVEQPLLVDRKNIKMTREQWNKEEGKVPLVKYQESINARSEDLKIFSRVIDNITQVNPTFGKPYFKVEIDREELEKIKRQLLRN